MADILSRAEYRHRLSKLLARPMFQHKSNIGFDIPCGWLTLLERLVDDLEALPNGSQLRASQVKEKFGSLRFYLVNAAPRVDFITKSRVVHSIAKKGNTTYDSTAADLIASAERLSITTCMLCGAPGTIVDIDGWYSTMCAEHAVFNAEEVSRLLHDGK